MDDKEFKDKLSKIAKWYIPIVSDGGYKGSLRKPMPESEKNLTLGPVIEELLPQYNPCEWCGNVTIQRQSHTLRFTSIDGKRPKRRWEHTCQTCRRHWDPNTGKLKESRPKKTSNPPEKKKYWWNEGIDKSDDKLG